MLKSAVYCKDLKAKKTVVFPFNFYEITCHVSTTVLGTETYPFNIFFFATNNILFLMSSFNNVLHFGEQTKANQNLNGCIWTWETQVWKQNVDCEGSFELDYFKFQKALVEVFDAKERR